MKKAILFAAALAVCAAPAFAQVGGKVFYSWNDCTGGATATQTVTFDCAGATPAASLAGYQMDASITGVVAISGVMDILDNTSAVLPSFWHMEASGCNSTGASITDTRNGATCTGYNVLFQGSTGAATDPFITAYGSGFGAPNRARMLTAVVRASSNPFSVTGGTKYFAWRIDWALDNAVENGSGTCVGCTDVVSQTLNQITLESVFTGNNGETVTGTATSNSIGSVPSLCSNAPTCDAVPTRSKTWGALKSMYR